jgi:hypothetical protein
MGIVGKAFVAALIVAIAPVVACSKSSKEGPSAQSSSAASAAVAKGTCSHSKDGVCSATEQLFVRQDPTLGCYHCLSKAGCIDNATGDVGNECEDVTGNAVAGPAAGQSRASLCLSTLQCILGSSCTTSPPSSPSHPADVTCYCGARNGTPCLADGPVGACASQINAGLESTDTRENLVTRYTDTKLGAGQANQIFSCAIANRCSSCLHH